MPNLERTIAWVEDDIDILDPIMSPLRRAGFRVLEYRTLSEAMTHIAEIERADLIVLDLILPPGRGGPDTDEADEYRGLELLRHLRHERGSTTPVIVMSVVANAPAAANAKELEALNAHPIAKPVRFRDLRALVGELLPGFDRPE